MLSVRTHEQLAQLLNTGRLDIVLMGSAFTQSPVFDAGEPSKTLSTFNIYHIYNKKYSYLAKEFDSTLRTMKSDGRYQRYLPGTPGQTAQ